MIAAGALAGDPTEPYPADVEVVAGGHDRNDSGGRGVVEGLDDDVPTRLHLGLADREVDHVHPVRHRLVDGLGDLRRVAVEAVIRRRHRQRLVVAEICLRRDARDGRAVVGSRRRVVVAGRDPRDVRRVEGVDGVERPVGVLPARRRRREGARDDDLGRRVRGVSLREAGGIRVAGRFEVWVRLVDPVVDEPDLDALAGGGELRAPERGRADQSRAWIRRGRSSRGGRIECVIRDARPDGRARDRVQACEIGRGEDDGDAVERDSVVPVDACRGDRDGEPGCERLLRGGQGVQVGGRCGFAHSERMALAWRRRRASGRARPRGQGQGAAG